MILKSEAAFQNCFSENVILKILQNSQVNTCARVSLMKR